MVLRGGCREKEELGMIAHYLHNYTFTQLSVCSHGWNIVIFNMFVTILWIETHIYCILHLNQHLIARSTQCFTHFDKADGIYCVFNIYCVNRNVCWLVIRLPSYWQHTRDITILKKFQIKACIFSSFFLTIANLCCCSWKNPPKSTTKP